MKEIATIDAKWDNTGVLELTFADHTGLGIDAMPGNWELSVPLLVMNQLIVLGPATGLRLCRGIERILGGTDQAPHTIGKNLLSAQILLRETSSQVGEKAMVLSFRPKTTLLGGIGNVVEGAVEEFVEQYARQYLSLNSDALRVKAWLAIAAYIYADLLGSKQYSKVPETIRGLQVSFSHKLWPRSEHWGTSDLSDRMRDLQTALAKC